MTETKGENSRFKFLELNKSEDVHKKAFEICDKEGKYLIITPAHSYIPPISTLLKLKDRVFICETEDYFLSFKKTVNDFQNIIIAGFKTNNFDKEFLQQVSEKLKKSIFVIQNFT